MVGNKALACKNCIFDMHGLKIKNTWSDLAKTFTYDDDPNNKNKSNSDEIELVDNVDWKIGDEIAIASTSHHHEESE